VLHPLKFVHSLEMKRHGLKSSIFLLLQELIFELHVGMQVEVKGLVLVGVSLSQEVVPPFARVLLHTSLARHMLRPLLRSEIGQVMTRRAWHDASKLTSETLDLYKVCFCPAHDLFLECCCANR
jgi:hypothetical protein